MASVANFLLEYDGLPNHPRPFGGRAEELQSLSEWLHDDGRPTKLMLTAPSGRGKSALLVRWSRELVASGWHVVFVPISIRFGTAAEGSFFPILASRLAQIHGVALPPAKSDDPAYCRAFSRELLNKPLSEHRSLAVIIDGLDEALGWTFGGGFFPLISPAGVKIVLSAREQAGDNGPHGWIKRLHWESHTGLAEGMSLAPLTREGILDVLMQMREPLGCFAEREQLVEQLHRLTHGDPLLVRLYTEEVLSTRNGRPELRQRQLEGLRAGYNAFFDKWLQDQAELWSVNTPFAKRENRLGMATLALAKGPLSRIDIRSILAYCAPEAESSIRELVRPFQRFIVGEGSKQNGYALSHPRLAEYFRSEDVVEVQDLRQVSRAFVDWGQDTLRAVEAGGLDPAEVSPYLVQFYSAHLIDCSPNLLISLICDGWRRAWLSVAGGNNGFAVDVQHAWTFAKHSGRPTSSDILMPSLGNELRCVLCLSSIVSLETNASPDLLALAVQTRELTFRQALNVIRLKSSGYQRVAALVALAPFVAHDAAEALEIAQAIVDAEGRAQVLTALAEYLPERDRPIAIKGALAAAEAVESWYSRVTVLKALRPYLSFKEHRALMSSELVKAESILDDGERARCLMAHWEHVSETERISVQAQVMSIAEGVNDVQRAFLLCELMEKVVDQEKQPLIDRIMVGAPHFRHSDYALVLLRVLPHVANGKKMELVAEAMKLARVLSDNERCVGMLSELIPYLSLDGRTAVVDEIAAIHPTYLELLEWPHVLSRLAARLPEPERAVVLKSALSHARAIEDRGLRAKGLNDLLTVVPFAEQKAIGEEVIASVREIENPDYRFLILMDLVKRSGNIVLVDEALRVANTVVEGGAQLTALAKYLPEEGRKATAKVALSRAQALGDEYTRAKALSAIGCFVSSREKPEVLRDALKASATIEDLRSRHDVLIDISDQLPEVERSKILASLLLEARGVPKIDLRFRALLSVAWKLPQSIRSSVASEVLNTARGLSGTHSRVEAIAKILPLLAGAERAAALNEIVAGASHIPNQSLELVIPYLPDAIRGTIMNEKLADARSDDEDKYRAWAVLPLLPYLPPAGRIEAIGEVLNRVRIEPEIDVRARLLVRVSVELVGAERTDAAKQALGLARTLTDAVLRAGTLIEVAEHWPTEKNDPLLLEALHEADKIDSPAKRVELVLRIVLQLGDQEHPAIQEALRTSLADFSVLSRRQLLCELPMWLPYIRQLGGEDAVRKTWYSIRDVTRWWP